MVLYLREDEKFVIGALCAAYEGTWRIGEDPPDDYMSFTEKEVAVEISILTPHVIDKSGKVVPRLSQDIVVLRLCNEINNELKNEIPSGIYVLLTISSPLNKIRQTKIDLINEIKEIVQKAVPNKKVLEINQNKVKIQTILGDRLSDKKVVGAVPNLNSSPYILGNALYIRRKSTMSIVKERMREIIDSLPDDASYEEIMRELAFERMVERGLEDSRKGRIISNEEMEHRIKTWQR